MALKSDSLKIADFVNAIRTAHSAEDLSINSLQRHFRTDCWHFEVRSKSTNIAGWADDNDALFALKKAYSEYLERSTFSKLKLDSTNGIACAPTFEMAAANATCELVERDAILTTWLARRPPTWLPTSERHILSDWTSLVAEDLNEFGVSMHFGIVALSGETLVAVAAIDGRSVQKTPFGVAMGFAAGSNATTLFERCTREVCRYFAHVLARIQAGVHPSGSEHPLKESELDNPEKHLQYYLHSENAKKLEWYFESSKNVICLTPFSVSTQILSIHENVANNLVTARACAPLAQAPFWGIPRKIHVNKSRFEQLGLIPELRTEIHPLT